MSTHERSSSVESITKRFKVFGRLPFKIKEVGHNTPTLGAMPLLILIARNDRGGIVPLWSLFATQLVT